LRKHPRQIVDELQRQRREHEVEAFGRKGQLLRTRRIELNAPDRGQSRAQHRETLAGRPEIGRYVKLPHHRSQPVGHVLGNPI
jgi:hypothetical protein